MSNRDLKKIFETLQMLDSDSVNIWKHILEEAKNQKDANEKFLGVVTTLATHQQEYNEKVADALLELDSKIMILAKGLDATNERIGE